MPSRSPGSTSASCLRPKRASLTSVNPHPATKTERGDPKVPSLRQITCSVRPGNAPAAKPLRHELADVLGKCHRVGNGNAFHKERLVVEKLGVELELVLVVCLVGCL